MDRVAYLVRVKGRVTGVGFRYSALHRSESLASLSGYIRNSGYAEVETLVQGDRQDVEQMLLWLRKGPPLARVDDISMSECPFDSGIKEYRINP
ncbi:MAG: acylphosphatase [Victivallales bacterium]|nr:acylphosphatase [Victivallales bacterium]